MLYLENYRSFKHEDYVLFACIMLILIVLVSLVVENLLEMRQNNEQTRGVIDDGGRVDETDD